MYQESKISTTDGQRKSSSVAACDPASESVGWNRGTREWRAREGTKEQRNCIAASVE